MIRTRKLEFNCNYFDWSMLRQACISISEYNYAPNLLRLFNSEEVIEETLYPHLLKSNFLVTHQPDWGTVTIRY